MCITISLNPMLIYLFTFILGTFQNYNFEFKNMLTVNSKSPSVEKKLSPVIEKNEINLRSSTDKKKVTPPKIIKTNIVGRRPGPKSSELC